MEDESEANAYKEESLTNGGKVKDAEKKDDHKAGEETAPKVGLSIEEIETELIKDASGEELEKPHDKKKDEEKAIKKSEIDGDKEDEAGKESNGEDAEDEDGETESMPNILIKEGE